MRLNCERNGVESTRNGWSSSIKEFVCIARFWNHQNDKKFGHILVKLQTLYRERCIWDYTNTWRKNPTPVLLRCYMTYLEYEGIWRAMLFREHVSSDVLPHLHLRMITLTNYFHLFPELNLLVKYTEFTQKSTKNSCHILFLSKDWLKHRRKSDTMSV